MLDENKGLNNENLELGLEINNDLRLSNRDLMKKSGSPGLPLDPPLTAASAAGAVACPRLDDQLYTQQPLNISISAVSLVWSDKWLAREQVQYKSLAGNGRPSTAMADGSPD